jgi:hypothetical protein
MIKRIKGSELNNNFGLHKLSFGEKDGSEVAKVELWNARPYGPEFVLADDEEIIGVYGTKEFDNYGVALGFIVWKPPKV